MSEDGWYVSRGEQRNGPIAFQKLQQLAAAGRIRRDDLVWTEGMEEWAPAETQAGLFPSAAPAPAQDPRQAPRQAVAVAAAPVAAPGAAGIGYYEPAGGLPPRAASTLAGYARPTGDVGDWPLDDARVQQFEEAVKIRKKVTGAAQLYRLLLLLAAIALAILLPVSLFSMGGGGGPGMAGAVMLVMTLMVGAFGALYFFTWRATMRAHRWAPLTMMIIFLAGAALNLFTMMIGAANNEPGALISGLVGMILPALFAFISWRSFAAIPPYLAQPAWCQELIVKSGL